ncbi:hypothetical protein N7535_006598 [Penicillium sp. DV-2018c]|nr:hypothetical protein N7535_006598 [Penicillium sp. DV-2018c]
MIARGKAIQLAISAFAGYVLFMLLLKGVRDDAWPKSLPSLSYNYMSNRAYEHIQNRTLGFEHIYAISMKERTDKRDFLTLAASVTGFKVEWLDGVRPEEVYPKAMPDGLDSSSVKPTGIACWRAHMNALVNVISNSYSTALIFEDDADWDVNIKSQLREFARGLHALQGTDVVSKEAPYGTDWDLLWIGGCASGPNANETSFYAIPMDPTVPKVEHRGTWGGPTDQWKEQYPELAEDSTRFIYRAEMGCCLFGYAVTNRGARKIVSALSIDRLGKEVDLALNDLCAGANGRRKIECWAPFPNLIGTYRKAGSSSRDSDIETYDTTDYHDELAWNMVYSTRRNIHDLVAGEEIVYSQWKEEDVPWSSKWINPKDFVYPAGHLVN